jgi:protoporphyrinogen/coproporphyrinogen III oxidase
MTVSKHVVIIGGGITGMAAAYELQEKARIAGLPLTYTLLERDGRLGGKIVTEQVDGFTIEGGPDCVISQKPWAADLARRLGIGDELIGTNDARRKTFVLNHRRLTPLPDGVLLIVPTRFMPFVTSSLISWPGKLRMGMDLFISRRQDDGDESVADFVRRRLGNEALDKIAEPLMSGIHVSDPEKQSLLGTFPRFRALEVNHRSLIIGMLAAKRPRSRTHGAPSAAQPSMTARPAPGINGHQNGRGEAAVVGRAPSSLFISLRGGLGRLVEVLGRALVGQVLPGVSAVSVERIAGDQYRVQCGDGRTLEADAVMLATPAYISADLLAGIAPDLSEMLSAIRYVSTATISLGFCAAETGPLKGFGYVVPRSEARQVSACTWTSTKFDYRAPADAVLLRCFVGGPSHEELVDLDDDELLALARRELAEIMGITAEPVIARIYRWRRANPQYDVGHLDRLQRMRDLSAAQQGLFIAGSAFDGVGVPDCVRQGQQAAGQILTYLVT